MDEEEFAAWVAEVELCTDHDMFLVLKAKLLARCAIYGKYSYEAKIVLEKKEFELCPEVWPDLVFNKLRMPTFSIDKEALELLAYNMPLSRIIEADSVKTTQEVEDREFLIHAHEGGVPGVEGGD